MSHQEVIQRPGFFGGFLLEAGNMRDVLTAVRRQDNRDIGFYFPVDVIEREVYDTA